MTRVDAHTGPILSAPSHAHVEGDIGEGSGLKRCRAGWNTAGAPADAAAPLRVIALSIAYRVACVKNLGGGRTARHNPEQRPRMQIRSSAHARRSGAAPMRAGSGVANSSDGARWPACSPESLEDGAAGHDVRCGGTGDQGRSERESGAGSVVAAHAVHAAAGRGRARAEEEINARRAVKPRCGAHGDLPGRHGAAADIAAEQVGRSMPQGRRCPWCGGQGCDRRSQGRNARPAARWRR